MLAQNESLVILVLLVGGVMQVLFLVAIVRIAFAHESLAKSIGALVSHLKTKDKTDNTQAETESPSDALKDMRQKDHN